MRHRIVNNVGEIFSKEETHVLKLINEFNGTISFNTKIINQRKVINKNLLTTENKIILEYYKLLINQYYGVKYPNRSFIMTELMNLMPYLHKYNKFTIYKFDFEKFFYNINPKKCFQYIYETVDLKPKEYRFLKKYTNSLNALLPGIGLHNSLIEVNGKHFDNKVRKEFSKFGLLHYSRYVDDCILILDESLEEVEINKIILKLMGDVFGKKLRLNPIKTQFFTSSDTNYKIDYLGYVFEKGQSSHTQFKFGITKKKLEKYENKIKEIILEFDESNNLDILNFKLDLMFKRLVYLGDRNGDGKVRWQVRGISDSYKELKRFMHNNEDFNKISRDTKTFFQHSITRGFRREGITIPAKLNNQIKNKKHISNFINNNALLLHKKIGLNYNNLQEKVKLLTNENLNNDSYSELAEKLLKNIN